MRGLGAAVVGTGFMGWTHVEALRRIGVNVVGIAGSSPKKSNVAAANLGLEKAYNSFDDLLADDRVQVVHIVTPNRHHFSMVWRAIESNRHVLCEKPLAMSAEETARLARLAGQHPHLAAGVNYNIRFYPLCVEARERVRRRELGELMHITGSYVQDWLLEPTDYNWRVLTHEGGVLRAVADIGTHWLDLIQWITSLRIEAVCADLRTFHPTRFRPRGEVETFHPSGDEPREAVEVSNDDFGCVMVRFRGGARGCLYVSQVAAGRKNCLRFEIAGQKQSLGWNSEVPNELWIGNRNRANELLMRDPALMSAPARDISTYPGGHNEGYADTFKQCFRAFYRYIEAANPKATAPFPTFADGHREMVLCDAILASHRGGRWIDLE